MATAPEQPNNADGKKPLIRAAQYVRMSTEHQQYSTQNQDDVIREYAARRGYEIVRTYTDGGKSGLRIEGRDALKGLIQDVQTGKADYDAVLVYDVSRWGRFLDSDESAFYEYICKRAGIHVAYCAEQFENDGSFTSNIFKSIKRTMAGEYSRELFSKVFKGQCRLIQLGFRQGGPAGYGLRRMLIDQSGQPKGELKRGEHKSLQTDRVILVPGPEHEIQIVNEVYRLVAEEGKREGDILEWLQSRGIASETGRPWTKSMIHQILTNEKYIGNNVFNRVSFKLKRKRVRNTPDMWVRADGAFDGIVDPALFYTVRGIMQERNRVFSDEEMVQRLKDLFARHGGLSAVLIDDGDGMPSSSAYRSRFGSLVSAYRLAGYVPERDYGFVQVNRHMRTLYPGLSSQFACWAYASKCRPCSNSDTSPRSRASQVSNYAIAASRRWIRAAHYRARRSKGGGSAVCPACPSACAIIQTAPRNSDFTFRAQAAVSDCPTAACGDHRNQYSPDVFRNPRKMPSRMGFPKKKRPETSEKQGDC